MRGFFTDRMAEDYSKAALGSTLRLMRPVLDACTACVELRWGFIANPGCGLEGLAQAERPGQPVVLKSVLTGVEYGAYFVPSMSTGDAIFGLVAQIDGKRLECSSYVPVKLAATDSLVKVTLGWR